MPNGDTIEVEVRLKSDAELRSLYLAPGDADASYLEQVAAELRRRDGEAFARLAEKKQERATTHELSATRLPDLGGAFVHNLQSPILLRVREDQTISLLAGYDPPGTLLLAAILCLGAFALSRGALGLAVVPGFVALYFAIRSARRRSRESSVESVLRIVRDREHGNLAVLAVLDGKEGWFGLSCGESLDRVVDRLMEVGKCRIEDETVKDPLGMSGTVFWVVVAGVVILLVVLYS